jgi:hypothetical protein
MFQVPSTSVKTGTRVKIILILILILETTHFRSSVFLARLQWLMTVILATQEAQMRRTAL